MSASAAQVCCTHLIEGLNDNLVSISTQSFEKIWQCRQEWLFLDGKEKEIADYLSISNGFGDDGSLENELTITMHITGNSTCDLRTKQKFKELKKEWKILIRLMSIQP
ncbi:hypothetical protein AVEN_219248-1 [Araneus ventricosus]|uniref:Uncharacterized protein n=1 Tax=Araneus ventricosus TaxID=182803 RepID=A0A4Y2L363_ARAVE|nr:hypothetical protein AVEN_76325-1 [Araneus ventricosus]GBN09111.1 hypothetical protein AVEN_219248-1 [Araneus ventricosus]